MALNCPKCNGTLAPVTFAGVEIDRCAECSGIWFDGGEVEQLKETRGSEAIDVGNPERGRELDRAAATCPRCAEAMTRALDVDAYQIWYERCVDCGGVWLDAGEFVKFKTNFQPSLLRRFQGWIGRS